MENFTSNSGTSRNFKNKIYKIKTSKKFSNWDGNGALVLDEPV